MNRGRVEKARRIVKSESDSDRASATPRRLGVLLAALLVLVAPGRSAGQAYPGAGDGLMYIGTYDGTIHVLSEATGERIDRIPLEVGIARDAILGRDGRRFYILSIDYERIEVVDIAAKETVDVFSLSGGNEKVRIWRYAVSPGGSRVVLLAQRYRRLVDRWEIDEPELLVYDLESHEVAKRIPWPGGEPRSRVSMRFSPDGGLLYFFMDQVRVYETENFTETDRWNFGRILDQGMGSLDFGFGSSPYEEEGHFTDLFRVEEPANRRELMGVARVDLAGRSVDFFTLGPSEDLRFTLGPDGRAYGLHIEIGNYQLWTFDLETRSVAARIPIRGRTRMRLEASSNGRYLYVWQAGNTIDLLDPETGRYVHTIELDADTTTDLIVVPGGGPAAADGS